MMVRLLASFFGLGYLPFAPGTWGTLGGVLIYFLEGNLFFWWKLLILIIIFFIGIWVADLADRSWGTHDNGKIVIDEVAGYLVGVIIFSFTWQRAIGAFFLFRFFDVLKIPPANIADKKIGGGFGVMVDDTVSGIYTLIVMLFLFKFGVV